MSTRKIKDAKDLSTNELVYFKGHAKATYMSDGSTVEDTVKVLEKDIDEISTNLSDLATKDELEGLTNEVIDNEFVVATTLTYLDGKVDDVIQTIEENELVTATALTNLDNRLLEVESGAVGNEGTITGVSVNGTSIATSGVANIPAASTSAYGVTKLTTATTSTSTTEAATASAVKAAYDLANSYKGTITGVKVNGTSIATSGVANIPAASTSAYGVTKLTTATTSTSTTLAATASAVKAAYDLANSYKGTVTEVKVNGTSKTPTSGVVDLGTVITAHQDISHLATKEEVEDLTNEVIDNEFVVATTLTYLDGKVTDVIQTIEENELVTATALTNLDNRLLEVESGAVGGNEGTITGISVNGTSIATSGVANIPAASTSAYGVTKLTTATTSTSTTLAATASAVKAAYDLANSYKGTITGVSVNGTSVATSGTANIPSASTSAYGVTKLTSATNSTSTTLAATASAVKAAYDLANSYKGTVTSVKINGSSKSPSSGVVDLGTVLTSHQDISHLATKEEVENLTNEVIDNEFVVATTLTYLDGKVADVIQTIEENELVTATALTNLDNRIGDINAVLETIISGMGTN